MTDAPRHAAPESEDVPQDSPPVEAPLPAAEDASAPVDTEGVSSLDRRHESDGFDEETPTDAQPDYDAEDTDEAEEVLDESFNGEDEPVVPESPKTEGGK